MRYCIYKLSGKAVGYRCAPDTEKEPPDLCEGWTFQYRESLKGVKIFDITEIDSKLKEEKRIAKEGAKILRKMARESLGLPPEE